MHSAADANPTEKRFRSRSDRVDPELILRAAVRRLTQLAEDCAGANISKVDFPAIIQGAKGCSISESELSWHQLERYSSRQKQQLRLGGLVGQFVLTGSALRILLPLLVWSELTHLGKNTVFGLGQVKLAPAE
ncbi:MAG: CRISPR system precrRNA processing endoribonuclease RAMP protein Cas6 [Bacillota bacterium]